MGVMFLNRLKFLGQLRVADFTVVKVGKADAHAVLRFAFAQVMEIGAPARILFQVFRHMPGEKNVTGVTAIHHPLRDVDARAGNIGMFVQITDFIDRAAVNAHADAQFRMALQRLADFQSAQRRRLRSVAKNQRAAVPGRQAQEFAFRFSAAELLCSTHDFFQLLQQLALLANQPLGVADDVDEQDMPDLETQTGLFGRMA